MMLAPLHSAVSMLAFFQATQLNLFERFLNQAVSGINSTSITSGMQTAAYVVLLVGFLWQVYQSVLHGGDVRGLGTSLIKYVVTALIVMNYSAVFTTVNQGFVNAGNWISNASGGGNLLENWMSDLKTQYSQDGVQQMWSLITGSMAGLLDGLLIIVAYILYPFVVAIFGFFYIFYGSVLYIFGPLVIALMPLGATNRLAKSYVENLFIWNSWPILYGGFGALLSAVQMGQVGQMLNQNDFLGGLGNIEGSFLIGAASIIYSLAIAVIPWVAKRIVSGEVGATAAALVGTATAALTAGAAAFEGAAVGAAAGGAGATTGAPAGNATVAATGNAGQSAMTFAGSNQPAPPQQSPKAANALNQSAIGSSSLTSPNLSSRSVSGSGPTAEGHAEQIRSFIGDAIGVDTADEQGATTTPTPATGGNSSPSGRLPGSSGKSNGSPRPSGSARRGPSMRRYDIGTWGAYHAARLAAHGIARVASRPGALEQE